MADSGFTVPPMDISERNGLCRLLIEPTGEPHRYRVTNRDNSHAYTVAFFVRDGKWFARCTCKAGSDTAACKHVDACASYRLQASAQRNAA
jgi:hypothetical protein